jgi:hypothetical protein
MARSPRIALHLWTSAALLRVLKRFVPLEGLVRLMNRKPSPGRRWTGLPEELERYMCTAGRFPWRAPGNCLERSLGAYRLLCEAAAEPELVIGVRRPTDSTVGGHVWVTVAGRPIAEQAEHLAGFVPIVTFDASGRRHTRGETPDQAKGGFIS